MVTRYVRERVTLPTFLVEGPVDGMAVNDDIHSP